MSVQLYWRERLLARNPIYCEALRVPMVAFRPHRNDMDNPWPHAVARQALLQDYLVWHEEVYLAPYRDTPYFRDNPDRLPKPEDNLGFFSMMSPWLYLVGKERQVRPYLVPKKVDVDGKWVDTKVNQYFIRLCPWETHVAAYEHMTGVKLDAMVEVFCADKAHTIAKAHFGKAPSAS